MLIMLVVLLGSANCFFVLFRAPGNQIEGGEQLFLPDDTFYETFYKTFQVRGSDAAWFLFILAVKQSHILPPGLPLLRCWCWATAMSRRPSRRMSRW